MRNRQSTNKLLTLKSPVSIAELNERPGFKLEAKDKYWDQVNLLAPESYTDDCSIESDASTIVDKELLSKDSPVDLLKNQ